MSLAPVSHSSFKCSLIHLQSLLWTIVVLGNAYKVTIIGYQIKSDLTSDDRCLANFAGDFGRPYERIHYVNVWNIEQTTRFVEFFSCFLFSDAVVGGETLSPLARLAWGHWRRFVMHHLRPPHDAYQEENRKKAREELLAFSAILQKHLPKLCTLNLHLLNCYLWIQEKNCGLVRHRHEMWVEQMMQLAKGRTQTVYAPRPEFSIAKKVQMAAAIAGEYHPHYCRFCSP